MPLSDFSITWKLNIGFFVIVWHFPTNRNQPFDILRLKVWHFPSQGNYSFEFLWPSDIFHHKETHHWIFCDRLTFSIRCKPTIWLFVTVWHFPTGRKSPLDYLWPSDMFQHHSWVLDYFLPQMQIVGNVRFALSWGWKMCDNVSHFPHLNFEHFPA